MHGRASEPRAVRAMAVVVHRACCVARAAFDAIVPQRKCLACKCWVGGIDARVNDPNVDPGPPRVGVGDAQHIAPRLCFHQPPARAAAIGFVRCIVVLVFKSFFLSALVAMYR